MIKKIPVNRLSIGMYLCGNDRKWLETPFFRRKFLLKTDHQIAELLQYCKFVLIDTDKGADISEAQLPEIINDIQGCNHKCDYGVYPVGSIIELDNGQMAIVVKANLDNPLTPDIMLVTDTNKNILSMPKSIDLADAHNQLNILGKLTEDDPLNEFIKLFYAEYKPY